MISSDDTHSSTKRPSDEGKEEGGLVVSRFRIELPTNEARVGRVPSSEEDTDDGEDRVPEHQEITTSPPRRKRKRRKCSQNGQKSKTLTLTLAHSLRTSLELVGLQVWGAAFPLLDYVILNSDRFKGKKVIEIGCGTGVLSIILAYVGADVIATDYDNRVLCLANRNIEANSHIIHPEFIVFSKDEPFGIRQENTVQVCKLDWLAKHIDCPVSMFLLTGVTTECGSDLATQWQEHNLNMFKDADYFCASDVIYDDFLTDSLFKKLSLWLTGGKVMAPEGGDASDGKYLVGRVVKDTKLLSYLLKKDTILRLDLALWKPTATRTSRIG